VPLRWLRAKDPNWYAARRALKAAVVVPINFAIGSQVIGDAQLATFAAFGSFALLLFVAFPGGLAARAGAYLVLAVAGVVLITVGTLIATPDWLAVVGMLVVAFGILFAGSISSTLSAGTQAAMLAFILAVMLPGLRSDLPARLGGWGIACGVAIPVSLFVWPPDDQNLLRLKAAQVCRALARMLSLDQPPPGEGDPLVALSRAAAQLRQAFRTSASRVVALSAGARLVVRLVDELEWLTTAVINACADAPEQWPEQGRRLRASSARVLAAAADTLDHDGNGPSLAACGTLENCLVELNGARDSVADEALDELRESTDPTAGEFDRPLIAAHELGYTVALSGRTVAAIAAADSRPWWARMLGRRPQSVDEVGAVTVAQRVASGHLDRHSVWLQNSVRGAMGLALAVLLARLFDAQNAFWIGLGAISVLRSNALATGATVLRALLGTVIGFAIGGAAVVVIGTNHAVLWTLLPLVIFIAGSAPTVISFVAGQAAFTVFSIILFNIIAPAGWRIGVFRIEDVALGCLASLVAGFLFWPRGAGAALGVAFADAYRSSSAFLQQSIRKLTAEPLDDADVTAEAQAAGVRLDDALRQYLAEKGSKHVPLESVAALANGATRLRLAGVAITSLKRAAPDGHVVVDGDEQLRRPVSVLNQRADRLSDWYTDLAASFGNPAHPALPGVDDDRDDDESFLEVVLPEVERCGDRDRAVRAEQLLWSGQYLGDVNRQRAELLEPAEQVWAVQTRPWWRR
jgi:uncharacterized membrane protein YccC